MKNCQFTSDNASGMHPHVLTKLGKANEGFAMPYGDDAWTAQAHKEFARVFGDDCTAYLVPLGTGANVLALRAMLKPWQGIVAGEKAHILNAEASAVERIAGTRIMTLPTTHAKICPKDVLACAEAVPSAHHVQPGVLSLTQSTEQGTVYTVEELRALCDAAHAGGMLVHMDGTRLANAAAHLGVSLRAISKDVGVDVLCFGGSKNGLMCAESVVVFNPTITTGMLTLRKQCCQLYSKMRFISAQFLAYFEDDLWQKNAAHANAMALYMQEKLEAVKGVRIMHPVEANGVFAAMSPNAIQLLQQKYAFNVVDPVHFVARWLCSFTTTREDIDSFVQAVEEAASKG